MRTFSFYHQLTGLFNGRTFSTDDPSMLEKNLQQPEHVPIEGEYDHFSQRFDVETKSVIDYQPPAPSPHHEWNVDTKRWQLSAAVRKKAAARSGSLARIASLEASQHAVVRELLLGDLSARPRLQVIADEIASLQTSL